MNHFHWHSVGKFMPMFQLFKVIGETLAQ